MRIGISPISMGSKVNLKQYYDGVFNVDLIGEISFLESKILESQILGDHCKLEFGSLVAEFAIFFLSVMLGRL